MEGNVIKPSTRSQNNQPYEKSPCVTWSANDSVSTIPVFPLFSLNFDIETSKPKSSDRHALWSQSHSAPDRPAWSSFPPAYWSSKLLYGGSLSAPVRASMWLTRQPLSRPFVAIAWKSELHLKWHKTGPTDGLSYAFVVGFPAGLICGYSLWHGEQRVCCLIKLIIFFYFF